MTYQGCSLFLNGIPVSDTVTWTPPEIAVDRVWFKTGAMNAPVPIDRGTQAMTATFKCAGMSVGAMVLFGAIPGIKARLTVRRAYRGAAGDNRVSFLEEEVEGFIDAVRADEHGAGSKSDVGQTMSVSASYYKVSLDGIVPLLEINPALGLRKILGVNVNGIPADFISLLL